MYYNNHRHNRHNRHHQSIITKLLKTQQIRNEKNASTRTANSLSIRFHTLCTTLTLLIPCLNEECSLHMIIILHYNINRPDQIRSDTIYRW